MNTLETLEQRASRAFQHALSKVEEIGEDGVLAVERMVGLAPQPEPVAPANDPNVARVVELEGQLAAANEGIDSKTAEITTFRQQADAITQLLAKAWSEREPAADLAADAAQVVQHLQEIAIDRGDKLIGANTLIDGLKGELADANTLIANLRGSVKNLIDGEKALSAGQTAAAPVDPALVHAAAETTVLAVGTIVGAGDTTHVVGRSAVTVVGPIPDAAALAAVPAEAMPAVAVVAAAVSEIVAAPATVTDAPVLAATSEAPPAAEPAPEPPVT